MPEDEIIQRARQDEREGKSPSTQAGEFVREEMEYIREGEHGARSPEQALAKVRTDGRKIPSRTRSRATKGALKRESRRSASRKALSRRAKRAASQRSARSRSAAAKKAARMRKHRH